jgi:hypothetical protein
MGATIVYSTNELENAIDYLEKAAEFFTDKNDKHRFKWLMISLHGALYSFGICNTKGTNASNRVYKELKISKNKLDEIKREYGTFIYGDQSDESVREYAKLIKAKLIDINVVLERCQSKDYMLQFSDSKVLKLDMDHRLAIDRLIKHRNHFAHFKPMSYGITGDYNNDIIYPVVEVIEFLALNSGNVPYYIYKEDLEMRIRIALSKFN